MPNKKQQMKHAMTVQSAHMITTDYITLSQPLSEGLLLNDRTDRKLKLIHSLGELQPMHTYTTEYGNVLVRPTKYKAVLADSIELDIDSDEADFDAAMGRLALAADGRKEAPSDGMKMASYAAINDGWSREAAAAADGGYGGAEQAYACNGHGSNGDGHCSSSSSSHYQHNRNGAGGGAHGGALGCNGASVDVASAERLREEEALQRIAGLMDRLREMEEWFAGVKAEAERERRMREQSSARLTLMAERVDLLHSQLVATQKENKMLRQRVADLSEAHDVEEDSADGGESVSGRHPAHSISGDSVRSQGFGNGFGNTTRRAAMPLSSVRGPLQN